MGQRPDPGDVADRPEALARAQLRVDGDPVAIGLDPDRLQAELVDSRTPAGGDEQAVAAQFAAVLELQDVVLPIAPRRARVYSEDELDAIVAHRLGEGLAQRRRLAWKQVLGTLHERHLAAEATHGLGHFDADRPAAQHQQPAWDGFIPVTSRLVQMPSSSRRPGTGGTIGSAPQARTTWSAV